MIYSSPVSMLVMEMESFFIFVNIVFKSFLYQPCKTRKDDVPRVVYVILFHRTTKHAHIITYSGAYGVYEDK